MPALIIRAPFAVAAVQGLPVGKKHVYKQIECRGRGYRTPYRGAVAIFASRNRDEADQDTIADVLALSRGKGRATSNDAREARTYCVQTFEKWRYRLAGFVRLFGVVTADQASQASKADYHELHVQAFDVTEAWQVETYLAIEPLHALTEPGPEFTSACAGCLASPPHNAIACHVGWQTVSLDEVPAVVSAEVGSWPVARGSRQLCKAAPSAILHDGA